MNSITFKGKNNTSIEVFFSLIGKDLYKPTLKLGKGQIETIPLLLELDQIPPVNSKLLQLDRRVEYHPAILKGIVAGACSMTMKRGEGE